MIGTVFILLGAAITVIITAALYVNGITNMKDNYPDYKGEDLFNEEEENEQD